MYYLLIIGFSINRSSVMESEADEESLYKELDNVISKVQPAQSWTRLRFKPDLKIAVEDSASENKVPIERVKCVHESDNVETVDQSNSELVNRESTEDNSVRLKSPSKSEPPDVKEGCVCSMSENSSDISPIWCLDCQDNIIVVGCASGVVEVWDATTGKLKVRVCRLEVQVMNEVCINVNCKLQNHLTVNSSDIGMVLKQKFMKNDLMLSGK